MRRATRMETLTPEIMSESAVLAALCHARACALYGTPQTLLGIGLVRVHVRSRIGVLCARTRCGGGPVGRDARGRRGPGRAARATAAHVARCARNTLRFRRLADVDYYHCLQIRQILAADKTEGKKSFFFG